MEQVWPFLSLNPILIFVIIQKNDYIIIIFHKKNFFVGSHAIPVN